MSKISVFKFNIDNYTKETKEKIENIMKNYIDKKNLTFEKEGNLYISPAETKKDKAKNVAKGILVSTLSHNTTIYFSFREGFNYELKDNQLIVKSCAIDDRLKHKDYVHGLFHSNQASSIIYGSIKADIFKPLEKINLKLNEKQIEFIDDGSENKIKRNKIIVISLMIIFFLVLYLLQK